MAGTVNVETTKLCHCPNHEGDLDREIETIRYINDKPSVRRATEPFHHQRDQ